VDPQSALTGSRGFTIGAWRQVLDTLQAVVQMPDATFEKFVATWEVRSLLERAAHAIFMSDLLLQLTSTRL